MKTEDLEYFKEKLLSEKAKLESELKTVGHINPDNPNDWEPSPSSINAREADPNKRADNIEEYETNTAILKQLEAHLLDVNYALEKFDKGTYGTCDETGEEIPRGRLEANPAARTCNVK
ncbi:MAG: RNA polymerase-binding transcription factor DksA [Candidatus Paceibacteria bacterium]|jgi:RNA polymerase-binding transcription factor DksA